MRYLLTLFCILSGISGTARGHGGGEAEIEVGPDKGVLEITKDKAFKLAPEAKQTFGLKAIPFTSGTISLPNHAIVNALKESQIFRLRNDYLKAVHFKTVKKTDQYAVIQSQELQSGDQIVIEGVGFLRIIATQVGEEEDADAHNAEGEGSHD